MSAAAPSAPSEQGPVALLRGSLQLALLALCGLGVGAVARSPAFPRPFVIAFLGVVLLRLGLGRDGRRLVPRRALLALAVTLSALSVSFLLHRLARGSTDSLVALMAVVSVFEGLCLLSRQSTFLAFLLILLSSVHAAGAAIEGKDTLGLVFILGYVALLAWALLLFERGVALDRTAADERSVRHLRAPHATPVPAGAALRVLLALLLFGFPLGLGLYLAVPRGLLELQVRRAQAPTQAVGADEVAAGDEPAPFDARAAVVAVTGPGKGVPFGSVTEIKKDFTAWFEVWREGETGALRDVVLRDNVHDHYDVRGVWTDTLTPGTRNHVYLDTDDGHLDGWIDLGQRDAADRGRTLRIELKQGGHRRLYLQPEGVRLRVLRGGASQTGYEVTASRNETYAVSFALEEGDEVIERVVEPRRDDAFLAGRRSDGAVSPLPSYLQVPDACRGPLLRLASTVVGTEEDPWRRARLVEAWLRSDAFTYTLSLPRLDPENPIVDFLLNTRRANCEGFAIALTLMLRTLGHPTRYVRGFWGGDAQEGRGSVILRGHHYHAWTEMFLAGAGWIALNPTPPDRRAVDAGSITVAAGGSGAGRDAPPFSLLGYDAEHWGRLWTGVGEALRVALVVPLSWLFGPRGGYAGLALSLLGWLLFRRRRDAARVRRLVVAPGRALPAGPYGRALLLLARQGLRRRPSQTAGALCRAAARRFPTTRCALEVLTAVHERERYGGGASPALRRQADEALGALRHALRLQSRGETPPAPG